MLGIPPPSRRRGLRRKRICFGATLISRPSTFWNKKTANHGSQSTTFRHSELLDTEQNWLARCTLVAGDQWSSYENKLRTTREREVEALNLDG
jgi:hypothetical protein